MNEGVYNMLNMLVVQENIMQCKQLINYIAEMDLKLKIKIANSGKEALEYINADKIDIVVIDLNLSDLSELKVLNSVSKKLVDNYKSSIIVMLMNLL